MTRHRILKKMVLVSLALLFALAFASCSGIGDILTEKNNGGSIDMEVNDLVNIELESNPTTGYGWFLSEETDGSIISLIDSGFIQPKKDKKLMGAGGYEVFSFKAVSNGKTSIILNYERPWEEEVEPLEVFEITVSVGPL